MRAELRIVYDTVENSVEVSGPMDSEIIFLGMLEAAKKHLLLYQEKQRRIQAASGPLPPIPFQRGG